MFEKQAIERHGNERQLPLDMLGIPAAFLPELLALKQIGDDCADPLPAALPGAVGLILDPGSEMLGQVSLDGNVACHTGLRGSGAWNRLRKARWFYLCSDWSSRYWRLPEVRHFLDQLICRRGLDARQVRFD